MKGAADAWTIADPTLCLVCGRDSCEDHAMLESSQRLPPPRLTAWLEDAESVAAEGRQIEAEGIPFVVEGIIPDYGMLGMSVAAAKVGKTTFGLALAKAVARGEPFLNRRTERRRVLVVAAEDPPPYTAYLARHMEVERGRLSFIRKPLLLDPEGLEALVEVIETEGFGLVLISSWQAVIRGLVRDENDNATAVRVVEEVKAAARRSRVPWLIDAHAGKGEDQRDDADPLKALRGASAAAGAADYLLSLRYARGGTFGTQRRLSGKGRFVSLPSIVMDYDAAGGTFEILSAGDKSAFADTTWQLLCESNALSSPSTIQEIAAVAGLCDPQSGKATSTVRRQVQAALHGREGLQKTQTRRRGQLTALYSLASGTTT